jgi:hypothetical protein
VRLDAGRENEARPDGVQDRNHDARDDESSDREVDHAVSHGSHIREYALPNGWRVSGERRAEGDERVRCTRVLGSRLHDHDLMFLHDNNLDCAHLARPQVNAAVGRLAGTLRRTEERDFELPSSGR